MQIDAIITCVGRESLRMLKFTHPYNEVVYDTLTVATTPDDVETQSFCVDNEIDFAVTDSFNKGGAKFNKGGGIRAALSRLRSPQWILHLDSDIVMYDKETRKMLEIECNDIENFYGSQRIIVDNYDQFCKLKDGLVSASNLLKYNAVGHGYFQLWHHNSSVVKMGYEYPDSYGTGESDWQWRNLYGDLKNNDTETTGRLKKLSFDVWHLGRPDIKQADSFFS